MKLCRISALVAAGANGLANRGEKDAASNATAMPRVHARDGLIPAMARFLTAKQLLLARSQQGPIPANGCAFRLTARRSSRRKKKRAIAYAAKRRPLKASLK